MIRRAWAQHRGLVGYLFLVTVAVIAMQLYVLAVRRDLNHHDRISCEQRRVLSANQADVINALIQDRLQHHTADHVARLRSDLAGLHRALDLKC